MSREIFDKAGVVRTAVSLRTVRAALGVVIKPLHSETHERTVARDKVPHRRYNRADARAAFNSQ